jgi:hypothetical protein
LKPFAVKVDFKCQFSFGQAGESADIAAQRFMIYDLFGEEIAVNANNCDYIINIASVDSLYPFLDLL